MLLNFVDKSFDTKRLMHYRLSIQISLNGFSFCVFDNLLSKHVILRHFQYQHNVTNYDDLSNEIAAIFASDPLLPLSYPHCSCIYVSPKHTLIPEAFFVEEKLRAYLEFVSPLDDLDEIHYQPFNTLKSYGIFILPSQIASLLALYYKKIHFFNQSYPIIYSCLKSRENKNELHINLHDGIADIALAINNEFKLHNSFEIYHLNDAIYYIRTLLNQFAIQPTTASIYIAGDMLRDEINELAKFFPLLKVKNNHRMSMLVGYENSYRYYNMLMVHECE